MPGNFNNLRNFILAQQLDRGPDFTQEHQRGKVYNTPGLDDRRMRRMQDSFRAQSGQNSVGEIGNSWKALQEAIERSGEINRGPGFKRENYGFGGGKSWSSPEPFYKVNENQYNIPYTSSDMDSLLSNQMKPKSNYLESYKPGKLNQLSSSGIDNYNSGGWNSGMKDWR